MDKVRLHINGVGVRCLQRRSLLLLSWIGLYAILRQVLPGEKRVDQNSEYYEQSNPTSI